MLMTFTLLSFEFTAINRTHESDNYAYLVEPPHFHIVVTHIFMVITPSNNIHDMRFRFPYLIFINKKKNKKTEEYMYDISLKYSCNRQHRYYYIQIHFKQPFKISCLEL